MIAVGESTPGPIGVNVATYAGFSAAGVLGGIVATFGLVLPSYIVIVIVAQFLAKFSKSERVKAIFYGIRPAATAMIAAAGFSVAVSTFLLSDKLSFSTINFPAVILFGVLYYFYNKYKKHPIWYIAAAAVIGIIFKL